MIAEEIKPIFAEIYADLKRRARVMRNAHGHMTLDTTELVHESYLKIVSSKFAYISKAHLANAIALAIRHIMLDHARGKAYQKHGGDLQRVALTDVDGEAPENPLKLVELSDAIAQLHAIDARRADVFTLRALGNFRFEEIGELLGISHPTAMRDFEAARAYLLSLMDD
jgi:RNA polymerase sigma factor (TIGR02999 family)